MGILLKYVNIYYYNLNQTINNCTKDQLFEHKSYLKLFNEVLLTQGASCI